MRSGDIIESVGGHDSYGNIIYKYIRNIITGHGGNGKCLAGTPGYRHRPGRRKIAADIDGCGYSIGLQFKGN